PDGLWWVGEGGQRKLVEGWERPEDLDLPLGPGADPLEEVGGGWGEILEEGGGHLRGGVAHRRQVKARLGPEVVEDEPLGHPRLLGDGLRGGPVVPPGREEPLSGPEDAVPPLVGLLGGGGQ